MCKINRIEFKAIQYLVDNEKSPLLPLNQFTYIDRRTIISITNPKDTRILYQRYAKFYSNRYNRRKYVDGTIYTKFFVDCVDIICPIPNYLINIDVTLNGNNERTSVIITCDINPNSIPLVSMNELGHSLNLYGDNTDRGNKNDKGKMNILGKVKMSNGSVGVYKITDSSQAISDVISKVTSNVKRYYE